MKVLYYCLPSMLEHIPPEVKELSKKVEMYVVFEVSPSAWKYNLLDLPYPPWKEGFHEGKKFLKDNLPSAAFDYFSEASGIFFSCYPSSPSGNIKSILSAAQGIKKIQPDVLYFDGQSYRSLIIGTLLRKPIVVNMHEPRINRDVNVPFFRLREYLRWKLLPVASTKWFLVFANRIIVHSDEAKRLLMAEGVNEAKIRKALLGSMEIAKAWLDDDTRKSNIDEKNVLFWGWLSQRKGIDVLLDASPIIAQSIPNLKVTIAGSLANGYQFPTIKELPNGGSIEVIQKRINNYELASLLNKASVTIAPYREARQSSVILTSYGFKKPVVASDIQGLQEQVWDGETGLLFERSNAEELAKTTIKILQDDELRNRMSQNIGAFCQKYLSWEHYANKVYEACKDLVRE